jgi:hypothetical protein
LPLGIPKGAYITLRQQPYSKGKEKTVNLKGLTKAEFFVPAIQGVPKIPIDPESGDLVYPPALKPEGNREAGEADIPKR